jgi:hypothetical protein
MYKLHTAGKPRGQGARRKEKAGGGITRYGKEEVEEMMVNEKRERRIRRYKYVKQSFGFGCWRRGVSSGE